LVGCRVPSELAGLTWADVDLVALRIVIRSPKTKHHGGEHALRSVPLFPELLPYLQKLSDSVGPGVNVPLSSPVFPMASNPKVNLRTGFTRLIVKAGLTPWEKLFVNLRSSRETELLAIYPAADVCRWFGHSANVAAKFYAQARPEIAEQASRQSTLPGDVVGDIASETGSKMGSIGANHEPRNNHRESKNTHENQGDSMVGDGSSVPAESLENGRYWTRTFAA
jgi:hypothetical protein